MQHKSIRWVGITNDAGIILAQERRAGLTLLLTDEENEQYAESAISRQKTRNKFESKIGRLQYAAGRYERLLRFTIPIDNRYFLLVTLNKEEKEYDTIITEKILPFIARNKSKLEN